jgi:hypothetical protein
MPSGAFRLPGGGRKLTSVELEELLAARVFQERAEKNRVTRSMIMQWAGLLVEDLGVGLELSNGWLEGFLLRHNFVLRCATNKPALSDSVIVDRAVHFVSHIRGLIDEYRIRQDNIYSLDETALFFDHDKDTTIDIRGSRSVQVSNNSNFRSNLFEQKRSESLDFLQRLRLVESYCLQFS